MKDTYFIKCMADGDPSVFCVSPNTNVHVFVDMTGSGNVTFANGSISIPIENAKMYEDYPGIPQSELDSYFNELMRSVMTALAAKERTTLDICSIQHGLLENYWSRWVRTGYVRKTSEAPAILGLYPSQKKTWF